LAQDSLEFVSYNLSRETRNQSRRFTHVRNGLKWKREDEVVGKREGKIIDLLDLLLSQADANLVVVESYPHRPISEGEMK